ncbi:MAG: hypothetical protein DME91_09740 [Verrucomicrobia bacterium]|nr:MAG: hypothetical protein DME91_09740 [Verrucomicrobiota bacterium]
MKQESLSQGSTGCQPAVRGRLPRTACATSRVYIARHSASGRMLRAGSLCSPERSLRCLWKIAAPNLLIAASMLCFAQPAAAVTLEHVLQTTLEKNPAIQEAKSALEQASGQRLIFRSIVWPRAELGVPAGVQAGHRAGESGVKGFAVGQQLNVAVVEQLHAARLAFYAALYNRSLEAIREEQRQKLEANAATQKTRFEAGLADRSAFASATIQATELVSQIESAHRAYQEAQLKLAEAMAIDPAKSSLPEPEGKLEFIPMHPDLDSETAAALQRRADLKLARLFVRAAHEDQRIIAADYYPAVVGSIPAEWVPVTGIHRQESTSKTQDFIGSEIREKAAYTWRVIDNGKVGGAVLKARAAREENELTCKKLEANVSRELSRIANQLQAIDARESSLSAATTAAEESARTVRENAANGLVSLFEYRVTENALLTTKSGLLDAVYQNNLATAEWDRATGRYFQFSGDTTASRREADDSLKR